VTGLSSAISDYGVVLVWILGYALLATALAVVVRSVPIALAIGIAWSGPIEHLIQNAWSGAGRWFPGLLLEAFAGIVACVVFARRDVTS
jgi:ABC-2 type transport system permease protein